MQTGGALRRLLTEKPEKRRLMAPDKIVFLFLDGFGLAGPSDHNPMSVFNVLGVVLGKPLTTEAAVANENMVVMGLDATLGVPGVPQSATGQTALFTGVNAAKLCGCHIPAFPPAELQSVIKTESLFKKVVDLGLTATFANCYRNQYFDLVKAGKREHSVTTLSMMAANLPLRTLTDYNNANAIYWDITAEIMATSAVLPVETISPFEAGNRICAISRSFDLVVFETFLPDVIGHKRDWKKAEWFCGVLTSFIETIVRGKEPQTTIVMTSDHGNFEDFTTGGHTKNPAALCAFGPGALYFDGITSLDQFPHALLRLLLRHRSG
jgi:2,3-bisphosphoglycerate-independent phosphoglycerate mutase